MLGSGRLRRHLRRLRLRRRGLRGHPEERGLPLGGPAEGTRHPAALVGVRRGGELLDDRGRLGARGREPRVAVHPEPVREGVSLGRVPEAGADPRVHPEARQDGGGEDGGRTRVGRLLQVREVAGARRVDRVLRVRTRQAAVVQVAGLVRAALRRSRPGGARRPGRDVGEPGEVPLVGPQVVDVLREVPGEHVLVEGAVAQADQEVARQDLVERRRHVVPPAVRPDHRRPGGTRRRPVVDRPVARADVQGVGAAERRGQPGLRTADRQLPVAGVRGERRDRARQGAPGAVRVRRVDARRGEGPGRAVGGDEHVVRGRPVVVPALRQHQDVPPSGDEQCEVGGRAVGGRAIDRPGRSGEHGQFGELGPVRGDQVGQGEQVAHRRCGGRVEQPVTARRDHHRVDDDHGRAVLAEPRGDGADDLGGPEHPDLDRIDDDVVRHRVELLPQERRIGDVHRADAVRVLRDEGRHDTHAVPVERGDRLEVGLQPRAAGRVGARDAEHAGDAPGHRSVHASTCAAAAAYGSAAAQMPDTTATPAAPAARRGATSASVIPPIATHGTPERRASAAMSAKPACPSAGGWSGFVVVGWTTPTPSRSTVPRGSPATTATCAGVFAVSPTWASGPRSARAAVTGTSDCPRCTPATRCPPCRAASATSRRSSTTTVARSPTASATAATSASRSRAEASLSRTCTVRTPAATAARTTPSTPTPWRSASGPSVTR
ncbi:hypothetical protein Cus16_0727 [Curtobacterium sp. ER1/6]|nr:hypothetical protein Cus16_0727 [Curtobacterium sp. ER1/6]